MRGDGLSRSRVRRTSRVDTAQRAFLTAGNLDLRTPLSWKVHGDPYTITG
jgi:chitosanase